MKFDDKYCPDCGLGDADDSPLVECGDGKFRCREDLHEYAARKEEAGRMMDVCYAVAILVFLGWIAYLVARG